MVTDTTGAVANAIALSNRASKGKGGGRTIPLHPELREALIALQAARPDKVRADLPVIHSERARGYSAAAIAIWFHTRYRELGIKGARRTAVGAPLLLRSPSASSKLAGRCAMSKNWPATARSRQPSGTFRATAPRSGTSSN